MPTWNRDVSTLRGWFSPDLHDEVTTPHVAEPPITPDYEHRTSMSPSQQKQRANNHISFVSSPLHLDSGNGALP
jgi:hypothetical protein